MNPIVACAEAALRTHPHPALRLSELVELVAETVDHALDAPLLRALLEQHPERFRILEPWQGPWRPMGPGRTSTKESDSRAWVVMVTDDCQPPDTPAPVLKLRESVRWLGRGIDPRSPTEVSRWYAITLAERATREAVARRAA